ncbi:MAG: pyridoxamine 5'-phosphate oxidase family protein [Candidatus Methanomethylophilaceae archaeon]|nr:pyridoxamine 5'-phosphate oxidase family protein [Candidatus Methanomethylophilaceae archaeon]
MEDGFAAGFLSSFLRSQRLAVLATEWEGQPRASLIVYRIDDSLLNLHFLTPRASQKYRSIRSNPRVSLLVDDRCQHKHVQEMMSVTISGSCQECGLDEDEDQRMSLMEEVGEGSFPDQALMRVSVDNLTVVTALGDIRSYQP